MKIFKVPEQNKNLRIFLKKLVIFTVPVIFGFSGLAFYNYEFDPYGVIKGDMDAQITEPNQHYLKVKYVLNHPYKYDAFLFGSSRVGKIDVSKISDSNRWYNFTYSEALPAEIAEDLKILLDNGVKMKKVLIGLDELSYMIPPDAHETQSLRKPYKNKLNPFLGYLFLKPSFSLLKQINDFDTSRFYTPGTYKVIYKSGSFSPNKKDEFIEEHPQIHAQDPVFESPYWKSYFSENIDYTIENVEKIKQICREHEIKPIFFINPMYAKTYINAVSYDFLSFLDDLSSVTWFYDFSGLNKITTNKFNYYESSHYRPIIGDKIVRTIFKSGNRNKSIVNNDNIDSVLQIKKQELKHVQIQNQHSSL